MIPKLLERGYERADKSSPSRPNDVTSSSYPIPHLTAALPGTDKSRAAGCHQQASTETRLPVFDKANARENLLQFLANRAIETKTPLAR